MKFRKWVIGFVLLGALIGLGIVGWLFWPRNATPTPPAMSFADMDPSLAEVIQKAQNEVRRDPHSAEAWGTLAMTLAANGLSIPALDCYEQAERLNPKDPSWPYLRGHELWSSGRPHDALPFYRKALELAKDPEHRTTILFRVALILIEDGQLDEAEGKLQELNHLEQNGPRVHYGLGLLAFARKDESGAREHLGKLTNVPFARRHACALMATLLSSTDPNQARKFNEQVKQLPLDQTWPDPFVTAMRQFKVDRMSRIAHYTKLNKEGHKQEAIRSLQSYAARSPDFEVCTILANALLDEGQLEAAEQMFRQSLRYDPNCISSHMNLGIVLYLEGKKILADPDGKNKARKFFEEAVAEEDKALALNPDLGRALAFRGHALRYLGRYDEAAKSLRQATLADPDVGETHLSLGETLGELGQFPEALEHLKYAVELAAPNDERPRKALEKWQAKAKESPK